MNDFYTILNKRFGIMPPTESEQDWEYTCGDASQTEDYILFYNENLPALDTEGPYEILEENLDKLPEQFKPTALYLLNSGNW